MPRRKAVNPKTPEKVYLDQENSARLNLLCYSSLTRSLYGEKSRIINEALQVLFSPEYKEFLAWKAQKQQLESALSELKPNAAKS